jgi:hypothetical protein
MSWKMKRKRRKNGKLAHQNARGLIISVQAFPLFLFKILLLLIKEMVFSADHSV